MAIDNSPGATSAGAASSLDAFLAGIERRAYRMAVVATNSPDDALDIVQDSMMGLVQRYANRDADEWQALFYRILHSRINDWYRRHAVRRCWRQWLGGADSADGDPIAALPDHGSADPAAALGRQHAIETLDRALRQLPRRQQQALMLRLWEGMSVAETACAMACSEGSVKTHYSRAIHTIRGLLEDHWP